VAGGAWVTVGEYAEMYRRMAERARDARSAWLLRLAARVLEDASFALMNGRAGMRVLEDLRTVEEMLRYRRLPVEPVRHTIRIVASSIRSRLQAPGLEGFDMIGLPA